MPDIFRGRDGTPDNEHVSACLQGILHHVHGDNAGSFLEGGNVAQALAVT